VFEVNFVESSCDVRRIQVSMACLSSVCVCVCAQLANGNTVSSYGALSMSFPSHGRIWLVGGLGPVLKNCQ